MVLDLDGRVAVSAQAAPRVVELADPRQRERGALAVELVAGSMASSGNSERGSIVDGVRAAHILDPRSGWPARDFGSMTVIAPSAFEADCLSTGHYVMDPSGALEWATLHPRIEVIALEVVGSELVARISPGLEGRVRDLVEGLRVEVARPSGEPKRRAAELGELGEARPPRPSAGASTKPSLRRFRAALGAGSNVEDRSTTQRHGSRAFVPVAAALLGLALGQVSFAEPGSVSEAQRALAAEIDALRAEVTALQERGTATAELERKIDVLAEEIQRLKAGETAVEADRAETGLAPAASKVNRTRQGLSHGGYGVMLYQRFDESRDDGAAANRAAAYLGYKLNDRFLFNSELEHATTGQSGSVSVEFAYVDWQLREQATLRAGLPLVPMGFVNELHEPALFLGARRPDVERVILPTTWRENGLGLYGDVGPFSYRTYVLTGLEASGFSASGQHGGQQQGSEPAAEGFA